MPTVRTSSFLRRAPGTASSGIADDKRVIEPGTVLCAHPGEVFLARRVITPGAGNFLTIDSRVFHEYLADHPQPANRLQLRAMTKMSKALDHKLHEVFRVVRPGPSALEIQTAMVEFVQGMVSELLEEATGEATSIDSGLRTAERVRECLHYDTTATVDLSTLAKQAGVSRYQALRLFKRRYGLPPHTYQLSVRLALAQKALREGEQPVRVAAHYGFVDQSHFTRHFKRLLGVTPAQYARVGARTLIKRAYTRAVPRHASEERALDSNYGLWNPCVKPGTPTSSRSQLGGSLSRSAKKSTVARTLIESCRAEGYTAKMAVFSNSQSGRTRTSSPELSAGPTTRVAPMVMPWPRFAEDATTSALFEAMRPDTFTVTGPSGPSNFHSRGRARLVKSTHS